VVLSEDFATSRFRIRFRMYGYYASSGYAQEYGFYFDNVQVEIPDDNQAAAVFPSIGDGDMLHWPVGGMTEDTSITAQMPDGNDVTVSFAGGTQLQKSGVDFSGAFQGPYYYGDWYDAEDYGFDNYEDITDVCAYLIGDEYESMALSEPVRIHIPGKANKLVGWSNFDAFHQIATELPDDDGSLLGALGVDDGYLYLDADGNGVIDDTDDLVIWTTHFTCFVTYLPEPSSLLMCAAGALLWRRRRQ